MIILGIDPGIAIVGYGVIEYRNSVFKTLAMGSIQTPAGIDVERRLEMVYDDMCELIEMYHPHEMAIEELFFNTNQKTAIAVAEARAEKSQVIALVKMILKLEHAPKLDDTADALALAICHAHCAGSKMQGYYNQKKQKLL